jgi:transcriptional regulator with XRE-family HTH domain
MEAVEKVKKLMTERGLNQSDLAAMIGVSRQKMSLYLDGKAGLKPYQLLRMARGLGVDLEYLVDDAMTDPRPSSFLAGDEWAVLEVYRALRPQLDQAKAIRALSAASNAALSSGQRSAIIGQPHDPETGEVIRAGDPRTSKRRRQA